MRPAPAVGLGLVTAAALALWLASPGRAEEKATYVGDKDCMKCHFKQHKSWKGTPLAKSLKALEPTAESDKELFEKKKKSGLDPAKDYTTDSKCLKCHTTGFGHEGGYPEKVTADNEKQAKAMGAVSCEACHGPGSRYVEYKNQKRKDEGKDAKFTTEELLKYGLVKPDETNCKSCHNPDNPTNAMDDFKFEEAKAKVHDH